MLIGHSAWTISFNDVFSIGYLGVDLFFVISGYIITRLLLPELQERRVLRSFYIRRAFRILPTVCVYLAVLSSISLRIPLVTPSEITGSLFFYRNYQIASGTAPSGGFGGALTGHFWSLAIEEHFYLLWPTILIFTGKKRAAVCAAIGAICCATWRMCDSSHSFVSTHIFRAGTGNGFFRVIRTDERLDGLFVGCLLAIALASPEVVELIRKNVPRETPILCVFPILFLAKATPGLPRLSIYLLIALAIASTLVIKEGLAFQLLTLRPVVWIGQISYALYVWQELFMKNFIQIASRCLGHSFEINQILRLTMNLAASLLFAVFSTYLIERPMTSMGRSIALKDGEPLSKRKSVDQEAPTASPEPQKIEL